MMSKPFVSLDVYIVAAHRTAVGSFHGQFKDFSAPMLGAAAVKLCLAELDLRGREISQVIMGQVTGGLGINPAFRTAELAGIPSHTSTETVKFNCVAGLTAILHSYNAIRFGAAKLVVCGGQENVSAAPQRLYEPPAGGPVQDLPLHSSTLVDGLADNFTSTEMRERANALAEKHNISKSALDDYAYDSLKKAITAMQNNNFNKEIVPLPGGSKDENLVKNMPTTLEMLKDKPSLLNDIAGKPSSITDGNSAILADGAAALVLCNEEQIRTLHKQPLAKVAGGAHIELSPNNWGIGTANLIQTILEITGWSIGDIDLFEIQEVFAAQAMIVINVLQIDPLKVNISGGAIAFGHPVAASSANMVVTLVYNLNRLGLKKGIAVACNGKDLAVGIAVETVPPRGK